MIPLTGMSARMALSLVDATRDRQMELIQNSARDGRAIANFREKIGQVTNVDQLIADPDLYGFVMRTFDLEDQMFGKAMVRKILESDKDDPKSLVNKLTDPRFREMYDMMGFRRGGTVNTRTNLGGWQEQMVDRYLERRFINTQADQNETVGVALEYRRQAADVKNWFDVLKNSDLSRFMRRALGMPSQSVQLDIDRQAELFAQKFDIAKLSDPQEVEKLVRKFVAISDALEGAQTASNAAVQLMQGAVAAGGGQFVPITLDISAISLSGRSAYR